MHFTVLTQTDEKYEPPEQAVLRVDVIGLDAFIEICKAEETNTTTTLTKTASVVVNVLDLLNTLAGLLLSQDNHEALQHEVAQPPLD